MEPEPTITPDRRRPVVVLAVPAGGRVPEALVEAIHRWHPELDVVATWAGDPQLRPPAGDALTFHRVATDGVTLARCEPDAACWAVAAQAALDLLAAGRSRVVVLVAGSVGVAGRLDDLLDGSVGFVRRVTGPIPADGCAPTEADLRRCGELHTTVASFDAAATDCLRWIIQQAPSGASAGQLLQRAATAFDLPAVTVAHVGVGPWRWDADDARLIDLAAFDPSQPWVLDRHGELPARIRLVGHADRSAAVDAVADQAAVASASLFAPGGIEIDAAVRAWMRADPDAPCPWTQTSAFRTWLAERWWSARRRERPDLVRAFPPGRAGDDVFHEWCRRAAVDDGAPLVLPPPPITERWDPVAPLDDRGVDVVGYFTRRLGLARVGVGVVDAFRAAGVAVSPLAVEASDSPVVASPFPLADRLTHRRALLMVNADQMTPLRLAHPEVFATDARRIGCWFWEVEHVPPWMASACEGLDEVWAATTFVADALRAVVPVPVHHVPLPVADVRSASVAATTASLLAPHAGRFVFLVVFDHFSVTERKNPIGAIDAFRRAFAPGEGPVLVVKSLNARARWVHHERVLAAAAGRDDIVVVDAHLSHDEHLATIAAADALVSLHRSEGLGLHLAEAMWSGTPVVATRYSGNLDLMDDSSALLVDARMVPVTRAEGAYPPDAVWADPDLDQAAAAMRALVADPALGDRLAAAALDRMQRQPSPADCGRAMAGRLGIEMAS